MPASTLILNVDDNDGARYAKNRILLNAGFTVLEAANGTDALEMVAQHAPDLVLLDVKLPDINGVEVCRRIKENPASSMVLVLQTSAALTGRADRVRGLEGGADNYLAAPIEADELVANVNALLRLRSAQTDLRNSEERFRQLAENIEDVFWMFELDDAKLLYVSPAYETLWGRDRAALDADSADWLAGVHPDDRAAVQARFAGLGADQAYDEEFRVLTGAGQRWVRDRAFPVKDAADRIYRIARITSDITQRKEMERLLRAADSNKNEFLATLAHELRNPLSPIRNAVTLLDMEHVSQSAQLRAREIITRQVNHLAHLVDDLLDVARISQGKIELRLAEVELHAALAPAIETATPLITARGHGWRCDLPAQRVWLNADAMRLAQSVGNLLHNAAKFTPRGGRIALKAELPEPGTVRIAISDTGIGIPAENLDKIFGMFSQGSVAPDLAQEGLGIGLSLVRKLVELHGGRTYALSAGKDAGSTFVVELPVLRVEDAAEEAAEDASPTARAGTRRNILLVDDNPDAIAMMGALLEHMGHAIRFGRNGAEAIELARAQRPDVVILDIGLPGQDGYEVARILRADPALAGMRLIALTGYGADSDRLRATEAGFDAHLTKPAAIADLMAVIG
jgi:PAS domain S-box-containing protein